ncbi:MAG: aminomethyl-transferring glycine dehydrogenase subunit GcvPB [Gammaproteobacteria bacterium]|nr:aminomethyl-transferring glycine dehydrogenase subunit GcvPB [Gammaproteobacteria bacterium]
MTKSIFEQSEPDRGSRSHWPVIDVDTNGERESYRRQAKPMLPALSELDVVRHFTGLSQRNFSIDTQFYPLGSCTMKYNPKVCHSLAMLPGFLQQHPMTLLQHPETSQGLLACLHELQDMLAEVTGLSEVSLSPMAGAQGEFAGIAMIRAYHDAQGDAQRDEIIVPDAAHGTNPATAVMCGCKTVEIATTKEGDVDLEQLDAALGPRTAGIMLTNPSTLGVFERNITEIAQKVHQAGGLLYYDGANLNAVLGRVRPGDMGFDVVHLNLHKTFSTPHGGGGPGAGPVAASKRLAPFLPTPLVSSSDAGFTWEATLERPQSIGRLSAFHGNVGVLLRAYVYARLLGSSGMSRVADFATLNANYLMCRLEQAGFELAYPNRRASHEFLITVQDLKKQYGVTALDIAKRLLDYGFHPPTMYFPLQVPECLLIEPTETESKSTLDEFVSAMSDIRQQAIDDPASLKAAPHHALVRRVDETKAARQLVLSWRDRQLHQ